MCVAKSAAKITEKRDLALGYHYELMRLRAYKCLKNRHIKADVTNNLNLEWILADLTLQEAIKCSL